VSERLPPIYFVRHGETEWNRLGLIQGWKDIPLNETGHAQAQNVARAFVAHPEVTKDCRFAVSPLGRTRQTMAYISDALSLPESHVSISPALKAEDEGTEPTPITSGVSEPDSTLTITVLMVVLPISIPQIV